MNIPLFSSTPCPACGETKSISADWQRGVYTCSKCGASPINPYSSVKIEQQPEKIEQNKLDFLFYLVESGRL